MATTLLLLAIKGRRSLAMVKWLAEYGGADTETPTLWDGRWLSRLAAKVRPVDEACIAYLR